MKNYYNILGIDENASKEEIKKAYWSLAQIYHPDKSGNKKTNHFNEINEAQEVLLDESKRMQYDMLLNEYLSDNFFIRWIKNIKNKLLVNYAYSRLREIQNEKKLKYWLITLAVVVHIVLIAFALNTNTLFAVDSIQNNPIAIKDKLDKQVQVEVISTKEILDTVVNTLSGYANDTIANEDQLHQRMVKSYDTLSNEDEIVRVSFSDSNSLLHPNKLPTLKKGKHELKKNSLYKKTNKLSIAAKIKPGYVKPLTINGKRNFTNDEYQSILKRIIAYEVRSKVGNSCVQVRKTGNSNIKNAFSLARFLKDRGYIISGRETIKSTANGVNFGTSKQCMIITIGTL